MPHLPAISQPLAVQFDAGRLALHFEVCSELSTIAPSDWDRLMEPEDAPLLSWAYLQGLEEAGCVGRRTSWQPAHLLLRRSELGAPAEDGELVAAAPAYLKTDSDGEWVYDGDWAALAKQFHVPYYPKLVLAVPFNPVTGGRLLARPDLPAPQRQVLRAALLRAAQHVCQVWGLSSVHVLFPRDREVPVLSTSGFSPRQQEQYHFLNEGYRSFDDFLCRMRAHRRNSIQRERRELRAAGIKVRTYRGLQPGAAMAIANHHSSAAMDAPHGFSPCDLDRMFEMYVSTSLRYTGEAPYLNRRFFALCAERLGDRLELVLAHDRDGRLLAGAWNLRGDRRLYGRYWGAAEHVPFLHFEVCFYHSIERCIAEGLAALEPGHGGEQKLQRGFTPVLTSSGHYVREARLKIPIEAYIRLEAPYIAESLRAAQQRCPLRSLYSPPLKTVSQPRISNANDDGV